MRPRIELLRKRLNNGLADGSSTDFFVGVLINGEEIDLVADTSIDLDCGPGPTAVTLTIIPGSIDIVDIDEEMPLLDPDRHATKAPRLSDD